MEKNGIVTGRSNIENNLFCRKSDILLDNRHFFVRQHLAKYLFKTFDIISTAQNSQKAFEDENRKMEIESFSNSMGEFLKFKKSKNIDLIIDFPNFLQAAITRKDSQFGISKKTFFVKFLKNKI